MTSTEWSDSVGALTSSHFRDDALIGNNNKLKCGPTSKPCGNACIPKGHKCRASWNKPIKAAAAVGGAAAVGITATAFFHPRARARNAARGMVEPAMQAGFGVGNIARGNRVGAAKNFLNVALTGKELGKNARTLAQEYGTDLKSAKNLIRNKFFKAKYHRRAKGGRVPGMNYDSLELTAGDFRSDKKCGASGIPENAKCTKGAGKAASGKAKRNVLKKKQGANSPEAWGGEDLSNAQKGFKSFIKSQGYDPKKVGANSPLADKLNRQYSKKQGEPSESEMAKKRKAERAKYLKQAGRRNLALGASIAAAYLGGAVAARALRK